MSDVPSNVDAGAISPPSSSPTPSPSSSPPPSTVSSSLPTSQATSSPSASPPCPPALSTSPSAPTLQLPPTSPSSSDEKSPPFSPSPLSPSTSSAQLLPSLPHLVTSSSASNLLVSPRELISPLSSHPLLLHPLHPSQYSTFITSPSGPTLTTHEPVSPLSSHPPVSSIMTGSTQGGSGTLSEPSTSLSSGVFDDAQSAEYGGVVPEVAVDDDEDVKPSPPQPVAYSAADRGEREGEGDGKEDTQHTVGVTVEGATADAPTNGKRPPFSWSKFWKFTGPGWLMSIAYLDPGNLESDLQAGAYTGYQLLWVLLLATVLGLFMQTLALRLGVVTGRHLAQMCRQEYGTKLRWMVWVVVECAVIGSDIQEILGSALAFQILFGLPLWAGVLITAADTFTFLFLHTFGIRKLEAFFATLIAIMTICFFLDFGYVVPSAEGIGKGFIPTIRSYAVLQAVGVIGSIIMPHNMYLHSALVQSRHINRRLPSKVKEANFYFSIEAAVALFVSFAINMAVICVFARGFFDEGCAEQGMGLLDGECTDTIGLSTAGDALKGLLGGAAQTVWAIGLLASGQSSTMTGVTAGQFIMSGFMRLQMKPWQRIIVTRSIALVPSVAVALSSLGDVTTLDNTNQAVNVVQSVLIPFAILPLLRFTSNKRLMGAFVNSWKQMVVGWTFAALVIGINVFLVASTLAQGGAEGGVWAAFAVGVIIYLTMVSLLIWEELGIVWGLAKAMVVWGWGRMQGEVGQGEVQGGLYGDGRDADEASREARLRSGGATPMSPTSPASRDEKVEEEAVAALAETPSRTVEMEVA